MFDKDEDEFPIKCPHCLEEFYENVGRIKAGLHSHCPGVGCGVHLAHPAHQFDQLVTENGEALQDYFRQFKRLTVPIQLS